MTPPSPVTAARDERPPRFSDEDTPMIVHYLREFAKDQYVTSEWRKDMFRAAAARLELLDVKSSASPRSDVSEGGSERAKQLLRREGYIRAFSEQCAEEMGVERASVVFPLPKVRRPLRVTLSDGGVWSYEPRDEDDLTPYLRHGHLPIERRTSKGVAQFITCAHDIRELARILSSETEEVEDSADSSSVARGDQTNA